MKMSKYGWCGHELGYTGFKSEFLQVINLKDKWTFKDLFGKVLKE
jgi:hypothetical protein